MLRERKKLGLITIIYWILLVYVMAALIWWLIALNRQNNEMARLSLSALNSGDPAFGQKQAEIMSYRQRKQHQYVGEGITFMVMIWVGAIFVYISARRYLQLGRQQRNFLMAVTHEFKTPIAAARLQTETLLRHRLDPKHQERLLQQTLNETDRLNDLCDNILLASRFETGKIAAHHVPVALEVLVNDAVRQFQQRFPESVIKTGRMESVAVSGDEGLLKILISNLLDNALKYGGKAPVTVSLQTENSGALLQVADLGSGIPEQEKERVFRRFYRMGDETTRNAKGTGLGLYLAGQIAKEHRATISILSNRPQGSIFSIRFRDFSASSAHDINS